MTSTLLIEAVYAGDWSWFMVAAKKSNFVRGFDFKRQKKADGLNSLTSSINIVT